jgi:DNA-binding transcriptional LysR family regulator
MGAGASFAAHGSSKQSILALVAAGHGITLAAASQAEVSIPGVVFRPIAEENAMFHLELAWAPVIESPALGRFIAFVRDRRRDAGAG